MVDQIVEIAPVTNVEVRRARARIACSVERGAWYSVLKRGRTVMAEYRMRKKRVVGGNELSQKVRYVREHNGSDG